jgi:hypothetical protein
MCVCERERECVCVCKREGESGCVCVKKRGGERERVCVCARNQIICLDIKSDYMSRHKIRYAHRM